MTPFEGHIVSTLKLYELDELYKLKCCIFAALFGHIFIYSLFII